MLEEIKEKWDDILLNIKEEHDISEVSYRTWLLPLIPDSVDKDILTILVPDSAFISYVKKKYEFLLKITIEEITGFQCELDFKLKSDVKEPEKENLHRLEVLQQHFGGDEGGAPDEHRQKGGQMALSLVRFHRRPSFGRSCPGRPQGKCPGRPGTGC